MKLERTLSPTWPRKLFYPEPREDFYSPDWIRVDRGRLLAWVETACCSGAQELSMSLEIVVVSQTVHRANQIDRLLSGWRVSTIWASTMEECRACFSDAGPRVIIFDEVNSRSSWRDAIAAASKTDSPVIVVLDRFDSKRFVEILKGGASDVLADPLSSEQLQRSIGGTPISNLLTERPVMWTRLAHVWRAGRRLLHL